MNVYKLSALCFFVSVFLLVSASTGDAQNGTTLYMPVIYGEPVSPPDLIQNKVMRFELDGGGNSWHPVSENDFPFTELVPASFNLVNTIDGSGWEFTGLLYNGENQEIEPDGPATITFVVRGGDMISLEAEHVHDGITSTSENTCLTLIIDDPLNTVGTQFISNLDSLTVEYSYSTSTRRARQIEVDLLTELDSEGPKIYRHSPSSHVTDVFGYEYRFDLQRITYHCRSHHILGYNSSDPFLSDYGDLSAWRDR